MPDIPTEAETLARAQAGDPEAFGALVEPHLSLFYNAIVRILGNAQDAQDALQEALIGIHRDLPRFEGRSRFTTWAYPVCVNAALMVRRSRVRRREEGMEVRVSHGDGEGRPMEVEGSLDWSVEAEALDHMEQAEMRALILKALDEIPETHRIVFVLKDLEEWETEAIASNLGISLALVRQRLHRARMALQGRLKSHLSGRRP
ncbi:MAG TPA: sigma-70 family RNA polymerase sigma factor [Holophaga sp.]|nr:sigma-70 family RNA polymerase sigma factor [Holophaga sp.]